MINFVLFLLLLSSLGAVFALLWRTGALVYIILGWYLFQVLALGFSFMFTKADKSVNLHVGK